MRDQDEGRAARKAAGVDVADEVVFEQGEPGVDGWVGGWLEKEKEKTSACFFGSTAPRNLPVVHVGRRLAAGKPEPEPAEAQAFG